MIMHYLQQEKFWKRNFGVFEKFKLDVSACGVSRLMEICKFFFSVHLRRRRGNAGLDREGF